MKRQIFPAAQCELISFDLRKSLIQIRIINKAFLLKVSNATADDVICTLDSP